MLTVVKSSKGEVVFQSYGELTVETIDLKKGFAEFDYQKFIENIRKMQQDKKIKNKERFEQLKKTAEKKATF